MKTQLTKGEKIQLETRLHWITLAGPFLIALIGSILCIWIGDYGFFGILIFVGFFMYKMLERNNNLWVVTNLRIIDENGVFSNNTKESPLDKINNVTYSQSIWGKIFGFGNVQIQTAAEIGSTTYSSVQNPEELKETITQMQEEYKYNQIKRQATELASAISTGQQNNRTDVAVEIQKLFELKERGILTEEEFNFRKSKILNS